MNEIIGNKENPAAMIKAAGFCCLRMGKLFSRGRNYFQPVAVRLPFLNNRPEQQQDFPLRRDFDAFDHTRPELMSVAPVQLPV